MLKWLADCDAVTAELGRQYDDSNSKDPFHVVPAFVMMNSVKMEINKVIRTTKIDMNTKDLSNLKELLELIDFPD